MMVMTSQRGKIRLQSMDQRVARHLAGKHLRERLSHRTHPVWQVPVGERDHRRYLEETNLQGICGANFHTRLPVSMGEYSKSKDTHLNAILPFMAKDIAFINSVVLGTNANNVTPRNFSSMPEPSRTTSTTSTKISTVQMSSAYHYTAMRRNAPAIAAYSAVHPNNTLALVVRLQDGPSCPPCPPPAAALPSGSDASL